MSKLDFFEIFEVFVPKGQMGFNFEVFPKARVFTSFCVPPCFLGFSWHIVGHGRGSSVWMSVRPLFHFTIALGCVLHPSSRFWFSVEGLVTLCSFPVLLFDLRDGGAPHTSTCTYIYRVT